MDTHICPTCSQECAFKNGIMCTIQGCVKENIADNKKDDVFNGVKNDNGMVDTLRSIFGMK